MGGQGGLLVDGAQWLQQVVKYRHEGRKGIPRVQKYGHAQIYLGDGLTASAYPDRKGIRPLGCAPEDLPDALWSSGLIALTAAQREGIVQWCYDHPHVQYSPLDYAALTTHTLGLNTDWLQHYIEQQQSMICSQYTDAAYEANKVHLFTDQRWPGFVDPLDLALLLESIQAANDGPGQVG
jgi:hypothetical protein